jgi:hypothetical protein
MRPAFRSDRRRLRLAIVALAAMLSVGWSGTTTRWVAWTAVGFFPPDLQRQVRLHERRFDAGIQRGLTAPPAWRAAAPGHLEAALESQVLFCATSLRKPVPLADLVEELGVLAVRVLDANDPLAVAHGDSREPTYSGAYQHYVDSIRPRIRLVFYGQDPRLIRGRRVDGAISEMLERSRMLYPYLGEEFYRTGALRSWRDFDDRSVAFGVAGVSLSRGLTDLANLAAYVWNAGGGFVPTPVPTPTGHVGPTVTLTLEGGFPDRNKPKAGDAVMPESKLVLPPP